MTTNSICTIEVCTDKAIENNQNTVNARDLHGFLEIDTRFNDWISDRIEKYDFVKDRDYVTFTEYPVKLGRPRAEYSITISMAKELCMVEHNDKGKEARQYFIECEGKLRSNPPAALPDFTDPIAAAEAWLEQARETRDAKTALVESEEARTKAIRDRGKISNNREATAVGKIGGLTAANHRLKEKVTKLETEKASDEEYIDRLNNRFQKYITEKPKACYIPKERPREIKRYHVEQLIQEFAYATKREKQEVRREAYGIFNKRAMAKGFNIFTEAKRKNVSIIEAIRQRKLMDRLYEIVIDCMMEFNRLIPEPGEIDEDYSNCESFTGRNPSL